MKSEQIARLPGLEAAIREGTTDSDFKSARSILREVLQDELGEPSSGSTADLIERLGDRDAATDVTAVILRCVAVDGLVPSGGATSNYQRGLCVLVENTFPQLVRFLSVDLKAQTFARFEAYSKVHQRICVILSPLSRRYSDIQSIVAARGDFLAALNHGVVRSYCEPFRVSELRAGTEGLLNRLGKVATESATLTSDIEAAVSAIAEVRKSVRQNGSFLARDFVEPMVSSCEAALNSYILSTQGRFVTDIEVGATGADPLQKRYPLHDEGRDVDVRIPLRNSGPGTALDVSVAASSDSSEVAVSSRPAQLGDVLPGDFEVSIEALVTEPCSRFRGTLLIEWAEMGRLDRRSEIIEFQATAQRSDRNWSALEVWHPYSTDPAEGNAFIGRNELLRDLASRLLRSPTESFYITGQKCVGKTSLARASADHAISKNPQIKVLELLWGAIASEDPRASMKTLGQEIEAFLASSLPAGIVHTPANFDGTLSPLIKQAKLLEELVPDRRFIVIIDEFDEIRQELYLFGNLAETFFANLRALSGTRNVGFVLVGGENMPFVMGRQGQKLNRFSGVNLSYFSRSKDWADYTSLVRVPSEPHLSWTDDGVAEVFNITNGNPYSTNIVCSTAARTAVASTDADVTSPEVSSAAAVRISSLEANAFAHLWQDGIFKGVDEREPEVLRRSRVLVAMARTVRARQSLSLENIANNKGQSLLADSEIEPVLNDFIRRDVVSESGGTFWFKLPLFERWLVDVGYAKLVSDALSEELSASVRSDEEAARVQSAEVARLTQSWPPFRGQKISGDDARAWFEQVPGHRDQRLLFEVLKLTHVFSEADIRTRLRSSYSVLRQSLPQFIMQKLNDRRRDVVVTYLDGEGKSGQYYAGIFAEENKLSVECIIPRSTFLSGYQAYVDRYGDPRAIVAVDDIAGTSGTLSGKITKFCEENSAILVGSQVQFLVSTLVSTREADRRIRKSLGDLVGITADFRSGEIMGPNYYAFDPANTGWASDEHRLRARALCEDIGSRIERKSPLGFEGQGLALVFPGTTPNNSLPILRSASKSGSHWRPLFPRISN